MDPSFGVASRPPIGYLSFANPLNGRRAGRDAGCAGKEFEGTASTAAGNTDIVETAADHRELVVEAAAGHMLSSRHRCTDSAETSGTVARLCRHNSSSHA